MTVRVPNELVPLAVWIALLVTTVVLLPSSVLRIILGVPFVLFFPGYTLTTVLFPRNDRIGGLERVALSFGLSIAVVPLVGLTLSYLPWGVTVESMLSSTALFVLTASAATWFRRRRLQPEERFAIEFRLSIPGLGGDPLDKAFSLALAIALTAAIVVVGYVATRDKSGEGFTEFYMLGPEGKAEAYPSQLILGEQGRIVVGIVNHERRDISYQLEVRINGTRSARIEPVTLAPEEQWQDTVSFTPDEAGDNQKVEILLYGDGETAPYLEPLHLWIDVTE